MKCSHCGVKNSDSELFCESCGYKLEDPVLVDGKSKGLEFASFFSRSIAAAIDWAIMIFGELILGFVIGFGITPLAIYLKLYYSIDIQMAFLNLWWADILWIIVVAWFYFCLFEKSYLRATPGKLLMRIFVADEKGHCINFERANKRFWSKFLSSIGMAGFIMAVFSKKKQALHDIIAATLVLKKKS